LLSHKQMNYISASRCLQSQGGVFLLTFLKNYKFLTK